MTFAVDWESVSLVSQAWLIRPACPGPVISHNLTFPAVCPQQSWVDPEPTPWLGSRHNTSTPVRTPRLRLVSQRMTPVRTPRLRLVSQRMTPVRTPRLRLVSQRMTPVRTPRLRLVSQRMTPVRTPRLRLVSQRMTPVRTPRLRLVSQRMTPVRTPRLRLVSQRMTPVRTTRLGLCHHGPLVGWSVAFYYWSLLYSAVLRFQADSLRSHVILHEWIAFYSAFLNLHRSGVRTALAWLVQQEKTAISARSVYTIQPCTMSLHAKPHT